MTVSERWDYFWSTLLEEAIVGRPFVCTGRKSNEQRPYLQEQWIIVDIKSQPDLCDRKKYCSFCPLLVIQTFRASTICRNVNKIQKADWIDTSTTFNLPLLFRAFGHFIACFTWNEFKPRNNDVDRSFSSICESRKHVHIDRRLPVSGMLWSMGWQSTGIPRPFCPHEIELSRNELRRPH